MILWNGRTSPDIPLQGPECHCRGDDDGGMTNNLGMARRRTWDRALEVEYLD